MTDIEKLVARTQKAVCVEEVTKKVTYYNCFGDIIDKNATVTNSIYVFDKATGEWVKGIKNETT